MSQVSGFGFQVSGTECIGTSHFGFFTEGHGDNRDNWFKENFVVSVCSCQEALSGGDSDFASRRAKSVLWSDELDGGEQSG